MDNDNAENKDGSSLHSVTALVPSKMAGGDSTHMQGGKIIFLNGTSSAGKTTLAHALQSALPEFYQHMALDQFRDGMPDKYRGLNSPIGTTGAEGLNVVPVINSPASHTAVQFGATGKQMLSGMRRGIAAMARAGINVIIDDIILETEFLDDYLETFQGLYVLFVGVKCPQEVIQRRENARPGRFPGTAIGHLYVCHAHGIYDVEVDTASDLPTVCAQKVIEFMHNNTPGAFTTLNQSAKKVNPL
ncbi:MAG: chloramphenicol 3-O phosphotransferase [Cyclobacteriaceae bacterium]